MRLKTYHTKSVDAAFRLARIELGKNAMFLGAREALGENGEPLQEVTFSLGDAEAPAPAVEVPPQISLPHWKRYARGAAGEARRVTADPVTASPPKPEAPVGPRPSWRCDPGVGRPGKHPIAAAFVGPPGAGKTSIIAKLAVRQRFELGRPVFLISAAADRVAAAEPLESYAAVIGAEFAFVDSLGGLPEAVDDARTAVGPEGAVLIDTAGYEPSRAAEAAELGRVLSRVSCLDVQLVCPAYLRPADFRDVVERFSAARPDRLVVSHADQTRTPGALLDEWNRAGLPISYISAGRRIPEDLTPAAPELLADWSAPAADTAAAG